MSLDSFSEPNAPTNLRYNETAKTVTVAWDPPVGPFIGYTVEVRNEYNTLIYQLMTTATSAAFTDLAPDTMYTVLLVALAGDGECGYVISSPVTVDLVTSK